MKLEISESGNGFPQTGELIGYWDCGSPRFFRVREGGNIETHNPGMPNTCVVEADEIDEDDVSEQIDLKADDLGLRPVGIEVLEPVTDDDCGEDHPLS